MQGRVICGRCGSPMYVRYGSRQSDSARPRYVCVDQADARRAACQSLPATDVDTATVRLLLDLLTPDAVEMTMAVQSELDRLTAQGEHHHQLRITRARYESDAARRRFMLVDPANRLVAAGLEAEWNARLSELGAAEAELARFREGTQEQLSIDTRRRMLALTQDLPQLWADSAVIDRERKEILALVIDDVTILSADAEITAQVRLRGGTCHSLTLTRSTVAPRKRTPPALVSRIDRLLELGDDLAMIRSWPSSSMPQGSATGATLPSRKARLPIFAKVAAWSVIVNAVTPTVTRQQESWPRATR